MCCHTECEQMRVLAHLPAAHIRSHRCLPAKLAPDETKSSFCFIHRRRYLIWFERLDCEPTNLRSKFVGIRYHKRGISKSFLLGPVVRF